MSKKIVFGMFLALMLVTMLALTIHPVGAYDISSTIYIKADGSIDPDIGLITKSGDLYTVTTDIASSNDTNALVIERDYTILDGASHTLSGIGEIGINLTERSHVTIRNLTITGFVYGIYSQNSNNSAIRGNNITANTASEGGAGIDLYWSSFNYIGENNITDNSNEGIFVFESSDSNSIVGNTIARNNIGIYVGSSSNNQVYHNNFIDNTSDQAAVTGTSVNLWDNGYPSGGNYWSDYVGVDDNRGLHQDQLGSDGIGDTPYPIELFDGIDQNDTYPLMSSFGPSTKTGTNVVVFPAPDLCLIFEEVTAEGSTTATDKTSTAPPPPPGMTLISAYYEISITAQYTGKIMVRMSYDGTGTQLLQYDALATDVNKDSTVDLKDLRKVATTLGSRPNTRRWDPACDVNGDNLVNYKDLLAVLRDRGKSAWTDITTFIDIESKVAYGETDHFSGIGVHR